MEKVDAVVIAAARTESERMSSPSLGRLIRSRSLAVRGLRVTLASILILIGLVFGGAATTTLQPPGLYDKDLLQDYLMARAIVHGVDPYLTIQALSERFLGRLPSAPRPTPTPHPPFAGLIFLPFSFLEYRIAATLWMGIEAISLVASIYLLFLVTGSRRSPFAAVGVSAALLAWYPVFSDLENGQLMIVLLLALTAAWLAWRANRPVLAGALLGLGILTKPVIWPVAIAFLVHRRWSTTFSLAATVLVGYLVAGMVIGFSRIVTYFTRVLPSVSNLYRATSVNLSLWSIGERLFAGTSLLAQGQDGPTVVHTAPLIRSVLAAQFTSIAIPTLALALASWVAYRHLDVEWSVGLMVIVSILVSPLSWGLYVVLVAIPGTLIVNRLNHHDFPTPATSVAFVIALLLVVPDFVWAHRAFYEAGSPPALDPNQPLPFVRSILTLEPTFALTTLAGLTVALGKWEATGGPQPSPDTVRRG